jgi:hypothetical protein
MATSAGKPTANGVCAYTVSFWARIRGPNHLFRLFRELIKIKD